MLAGLANTNIAALPEPFYLELHQSVDSRLVIMGLPKNPGSCSLESYVIYEHKIRMIL